MGSEKISYSYEPLKIPHEYIECGLIVACIFAVYTILRLLRYFTRSRTSLPLAYLQPMSLATIQLGSRVRTSSSPRSGTANHQSGPIPLKLRSQRRRPFFNPPTSCDLRRLDTILDAAYRAEVEEKQRARMAHDGLDGVLFKMQHLSLTSYAEYQMEVAQIDIEEPMIID